MWNLQANSSAIQIVKPLIGRPGIFTRMEEDVLAADLRTHLACGTPLSSKAFLKDVRKSAEKSRKFSVCRDRFCWFASRGLASVNSVFCSLRGNIDYHWLGRFMARLGLPFHKLSAEDHGKDKKFTEESAEKYFRQY